MDDDQRIESDFWVRAQVARLNSSGLFAVIVKRGDPQGGGVLIKWNRLSNGVHVLSQARAAHGRLVWMQGLGPDPVDDAAADAYIARQVRIDPDLWVIEFEDRSGPWPFDAPIV